MRALNKAIKILLPMICWAVVTLAIFHFSSLESYGASPAPLTIKVEPSGREVRLTANNYNSCEWTSSSQDLFYIYPSSGKTVTASALSWTGNWLVATAKCAADGGAYVYECVEFSLSSIVGLTIYQGLSGISRGESGVCQQGSK